MAMFATGRHGLKTKPALCLMLLSTLGCAENAELRTVPPGAKVYINEKLIGVSPATFLVGRYDDTHFRAVLDGYAPAEGQLEGRIAGERIFATIMTLGIYPIVHDLHYYPPTIVDLGPPLNPLAETRGGTTAPQSSPEDRLRHVQNMYDQGLINEQEYNRLRSDILRELDPTK